MSNHPKKTLLVALLTMTVALAGCTTGDDTTSGTDGGVDAPDEGPIELGNKGAISGLIVDDNFRPVQLKEEWESEPGDFQDIGFVLLLETGQRFETSANGEFKVLPLDPGTYTLRVAADVHEAKDTVVQVVAGEFTEVTVEARRQYSGGGSLFSQEETLFMSCFGNFYFFSIALAAVANNGCGDLSGDSSRFDFPTNYPDLADDTRGLVTEMRAADEWLYQITMRIVNGYAEAPGDLCDYGAGYCYYASERMEEMGNYLKIVLYDGLVRDDATGEYLQDGQEGYCKVGRDSNCDQYAFTMKHGFQTGLFTRHPTREFTGPTCGPTEPVRTLLNDEVGVIPYGCGGIGIKLGTKAQFVQNIFLYELPEEGIEDYCVLCEDADIPQ